MSATSQKQQKENAAQRNFASACADLETALKYQHHPSTNPSMNVEACAIRVLLFGSGDFAAGLVGTIRRAVRDALDPAPVPMRPE